MIKKALLYLMSLFLILGVVSASNGCNLEDSNCADGLTDNCDIRDSIKIPNGQYNFIYGFDVCADNIEIDFSDSTVQLQYDRETGNNYYFTLLSENKNNVTVKNLNTINNAYGIWFINTPNSKFQNINTESSELGISVENSPNSTFENLNSVNNTDHGIFISGCDNCQIISVNGVGSINDNVRIEDSLNLVFINNSGIGGESGFSFYHITFSKANGNIMRDNKFGITLYQTTNMNFSDNLFLDNEFTAFEYQNSNGNNWNDTNQGNQWDDYNPALNARVTTEENPHYKIGGLYDGVDYKPRGVDKQMEAKIQRIRFALDKASLKGTDLNKKETINEKLDYLLPASKESFYHGRMAYNKILSLKNFGARNVYAHDVLNTLLEITTNSYGDVKHLKSNPIYTSEIEWIEYKIERANFLITKGRIDDAIRQLKMAFVKSEDLKNG